LVLDQPNAVRIWFPAEGLFYHAAYTAVTSALLWLLVRLTWPSHLDPEGRSAE